MKEILKLIVEITYESIINIGYFFESNLRNSVEIVEAMLPFITYFLGQTVAVDRGYIAVGGEILIPIVLLIICFYAKCITNKLGKGMTIPLPEKRFTNVDDDGEVSIENRRIQELILYLADLEDWLERKGLL